MAVKADDRILELVELMVDHEEAIARLYATFAEKLPEQQALWGRMAEEEKCHAQMLRKVNALASDGKVKAENLDAWHDTVKRSLEHIGMHLDDVSRNGISMVRALAIAQDIEGAMLETRFLEAFDNSSTEVRGLLKTVRRDTRVHSRDIENILRSRGRYSLLIDKGLLDLDKLEEARRIALEEKSSLEEVLMASFGVPKTQLLASLGYFYGCPDYEYDEELAPPLQLLPYVKNRYEQLKSALFVPIGERGGRVSIAVTNPKDVVLRDSMEAIFHEHRTAFRVALAGDILAAIDSLFGVGRHARPESPAELLERLGASEEIAPLELQEEDEAEVDDDSIAVKLINRVVEDAYTKGASDIHIEPSRGDDVVIRYRIDGVMHKVTAVPRAYRRALVSRVKIMADLDIAERRRPQSGKISFKRWGRLNIELRAETYPTVGGVEDAVLRILSASKPMPIDELAMSTRNLREVKRLMHKPHGVLLCVGPTGSGKTTTLHSTLGYINDDKLKILTAEDPVEITQPGLRQLQVNAKAGLTFASALRSFLRADPDVIMIGEMRDQETASTAVEASLTGHLVLSTLHTNSAPETIVRLLDMGIDPYSFADALLGVLAQRLVRTLCPRCKHQQELDEEERSILRAEYGAPEIFDTLECAPGQKLWRPREGGCRTCENTGYRGRMAVHELLVSSEEIRSLIYRRGSAGEVRSAATAEGMRTLKQDGVEKVLGGHTSIEEIRAVCSG